MATTFQAEVEALTNVTIGSAGAPTDTQIDNWCTEGAKDIIARIKKSAPDTLPLYARDDLVSNSNIPTYTNINCVEVNSNPDYIAFIKTAHNYQTGMWVQLSNGTGVMAELDGAVAQVEKVNANTWKLGGVYPPDNFPGGGETCTTSAPDDEQRVDGAPVPSGIILSVSRTVNVNFDVRHIPCEPISEQEYYRANDVDGISYRSRFNPAYFFDGSMVRWAPAIDSFNLEYGSLRWVEYPEIDSATDNVGELQRFDVAKQHLISIYASFKALEFMIATLDPSSTLDAFFPIATVPTTPDVPAYSFSDASLSSVPESLINKALLPLQALTIPVYNEGAPVGLSTALQTFDSFHGGGFTLSGLAEDIETLSTIEAEFPSKLIAMNDVTDTSVGVTSSLANEIAQIIPPNYVQPSSVGVIPQWTFDQSPNFSHVEIPEHNLVTEDISLNLTSLVIPTPWNEQSDTEVDPSVATPGFEETIGVSWEAVNDALENEDFEEATAHMGKITTRVANQQQMFTQEMEKYSKEYDKIVKQADYGKKEKWTMELAHWNSKVEHYKMQVADIFNTYTNDLSRETSKWTQLATQNVALFTQEMTASVNVYNKEVTEYDKKVEALIADTKNTIDIAVKDAEFAKEAKELNAINQFKVIVDQYSQDISAYNSAITKYSGDIQYYVERYSAHFASHNEAWKTRQLNILEENKTAAVEALNIFNADNVKYQAEVQIMTSEFNSEAEALIKKMEVDTDLSTQNAAKNLEADVQKYNAMMDRYVGDIQKFQHETAFEISSYAQKVAKEQQDQTSLQLEYTWYQDKYSRLVGEYEAAFSAGASAPPQAAPQGA